MDWMTRLIDVRELFSECKECPNRWLKDVTTVCSQCIYKILSDKMECEKRAYLDWEKKQNGNNN